MFPGNTALRTNIKRILWSYICSTTEENKKQAVWDFEMTTVKPTYHHFVDLFEEEMIEAAIKDLCIGLDLRLYVLELIWKTRNQADKLS